MNDDDFDGQKEKTCWNNNNEIHLDSCWLDFTNSIDGGSIAQMKHLSRFQYSMRENIFYRYGSRLSLNIRGSIKFSSDLVAGCTWRATLGTCVFQSDFGFALNCAFKKSGLFRVRNLGGVKGYLGLGEWKRRSFASISADQSDNRGSFFSRFIRRNLSRIFVLYNVFICFPFFFNATIIPRSKNRVTY